VAVCIADDEDRDPTPPNFKKIDKEKVEKTAQKINKIIRGNDKATSRAKAKARYIEKNFPANLEKYEKQRQILKNRSSYSKTDPDANFMRMKEDHMKNGQLKPGYNVQISSEDQFIVNYTLHQDTNDIHTLKPHLENHEYLYQSLPESLTADAGYGSQENYELMTNKGIKGYVKFNTFDKEQNAAGKKRKNAAPFHRDKLHYNEKEDYYVCPMGQKMEKIAEVKKTTKSGFRQTSVRYRAKRCSGCPVRGVCFKGKNNRIVERNHELTLQTKGPRRSTLRTW